eukprot:4119451-Amphidinium_carterae.1
MSFISSEQHRKLATGSTGGAGEAPPPQCDPKANFLTRPFQRLSKKLQNSSQHDFKIAFQKSCSSPRHMEANKFKACADVCGTGLRVSRVKGLGLRRFRA